MISRYASPEPALGLIYPEVFDDFSDTNGTSVNGKSADTGQIWESATHDGLVPATIQGGAMTGATTTWYSKISTPERSVRNAGVQLRSVDRGTGHDDDNDQAFVVLIGASLDDISTLEGRAFLHVIYRPNVLGTDQQQLKIDVATDGVDSLVQLLEDIVTGPGAGTYVSFEVFLDADTLTVIYPGGVKRLTDDRFLDCHGPHVWIEAFNFLPDPRYVIEVDQFWANCITPSLPGVGVQPYSQHLSNLTRGFLRLRAGSDSDCAVQWVNSAGTGMSFLDIGGNFCVAFSSMGQRAMTILGSTVFFPGTIAPAVVTVTTPFITFSGLATTNPNVAGRLWSDSGTVKVSAG